MADNNAEQKPQAAEGKKEEKKESLLESMAKEAPSVVSAITGTAALIASGLLYGIGGPVVNIHGVPINTGTLSVAGSQPLGDLITEEKPKYARRVFYGILQGPVFNLMFNASLAAAGSYGLDGILSAPLVAGGITLAAAPILTAMFYPVKYFLDTGSFKGFYKSFKDNYGKETLYTAVGFGIPTAIAAAYATANIAFAPYLLPVAAASNIIYKVVRKIMKKEKIYPARIITYPIGGAISVMGRIYNGFTSAAYRFGSWIDSAISSPAPAPKPAPAPTAAPAPQPA